MPIVFDGDRIKDGDTVTVGEKQYELDGTDVIVMEVAVPVQKRYRLDALIAKKAQLEAELTEVNALIAKHAELSA